MPPVVPSPDQLPFFEELTAPPRPRRPHLRIQPPLLADLTARQRKAVTHGEGPLLIVAGAGTGKTTVITRRIAWLIAEKRALPSEILALTFTDRAALEMVERVDRLVPYGLHDAEISTFHAYGDRLLREHALEAGLSDRSTVLSRAEQIIFLREHLFELPLDRYRPLGDPTRFLSALVTLISRLRDEDVTPAAYLTVAAELRQRATAAPDDAALAEEADRHAELAAAYDAYERLMRTTDRLDFGDQVGLALGLLRDHPTVLEEERGRYRYILVDEFQDTNHAQWEIVRLLAEPHGNVTVVGDDDQSIYRFRGAALENILGFRGAYPKATSVVLVDNYRSRQPILDAAHRLISHNDPHRLEAREGLDKRLRARLRFDRPEPPAGPIELLAFATGSDEADAVADRIASSMRAGRQAGDHAILVRGNRDADPYLRALNMAHIPWRFSGTAGLYRQPEVRVLISFLRAVNDPDDSVSLYDLATSEIFGLAASDVTLALTNARRRRSSLGVALADAVADPERSPFSLRAIEVVQHLLGSLEAHRAMSTEKSSGELLYHFISASGWLARLAHEARETGEERLANVGRFFEIVRRQGSLLRDDRLPFLVAQLDTLIETGDDPSTADVDTEVADAVHVLTYHKAKGLEFGVVFLVGLVDDRFPGRERRDALELPDALVSDPAARCRPARRRGAAAVLRRDDPRARRARPQLGPGLRRPDLARREPLRGGGTRPAAGDADRDDPPGIARTAGSAPGVADRARHRPPAAARRSAADAQLRSDQRLPRLPGQVPIRTRGAHPDPRLAPDGLRAGAARSRAGIPPAAAGRGRDVGRGAARGPRRGVGVGGLPDPRARTGAAGRCPRGGRALLARAAARPGAADRRRARLHRRFRPGSDPWTVRPRRSR